ncbi:MAG TPA: flagellar hook-length control protein FliK [Sedimentisphaerales bacterium]|nr:flagellar hook-length control protein FliK [Sedimentisphaerales bacterium]
METKMTSINSILELPVKSAAGSQHSTNEALSTGVKRKFSSDDSFIKEQSGGFEKALKEKININSDAKSKENESDESEETSEDTKDDDQKVCTSSDQAANIVVEPAVSVDQVVVQASIDANVDLLNEDVQTLAQPLQPQNAQVTSDNNINPEIQVIANTQTLPQQTEQGASDIENQQTTPIADTIQGDSSQVGQLPQSQLSNEDGTFQNKSSDLIDQNNQQVTTIDTTVEDSSIKNASEVESPLLGENTKSQEEIQVPVSDVTKREESSDQIETADNDGTMPKQIKPLKVDRYSASQHDTKQNQSGQTNNDAQLSASNESALSSDNNAFGVKADNIVEIDVTGKVDNVQRPISIETDISTNTSQSESTRDISQAQNIENLSQSVAKQILNSVNLASSRNQNQITVNLNPPELGKVTIKFTENQNQISGVLQVSKTQTRTEIENALPQIIRNLESSGIQVKRIDVEVYDQNNINQQASKDQGFQDSFSAQQDSAQNQSNLNHTAANNTNFESSKTRVAEETIEGYQLNSTLGSESINLFA